MLESGLDGCLAPVRAARAQQGAAREQTLAALEAAIIDLSAGQQPVITLDLAGYVSGWNRGVEALFGYTETEALGRHALFLDAEDADAAGMAEADKRGVTPANGWCLPGNHPGLRTLEPRKGSSRPRRALWSSSYIRASSSPSSPRGNPSRANQPK